MKKKPSKNGSRKRRRRRLYLADHLKATQWIRYALWTAEPPITERALAATLLAREGVLEPTTDRGWIREIGMSYAGRWVIWHAEASDVFDEIAEAIKVDSDFAFADDPTADEREWLRETLLKGALAGLKRSQTQGKLPKRLQRVAVQAGDSELVRLDLGSGDIIEAAAKAKLLVKQGKPSPTPAEPQKPKKQGGWNRLFGELAKAKKGD